MPRTVWINEFSSSPLAGPVLVLGHQAGGSPVSVASDLARAFARLHCSGTAKQNIARAFRLPLEVVARSVFLVKVSWLVAYLDLPMLWFAVEKDAARGLALDVTSDLFRKRFAKRTIMLHARECGRGCSEHLVGDGNCRVAARTCVASVGRRMPAISQPLLKPCVPLHVRCRAQPASQSERCFECQVQGNTRPSVEPESTLLCCPVEKDVGGRPRTFEYGMFHICFTCGVSLDFQELSYSEPLSFVMERFEACRAHLREAGILLRSIGYDNGCHLSGISVASIIDPFLSVKNFTPPRIIKTLPKTSPRVLQVKRSPR